MAEGQVDQSLTAQSTAVLDVQEDGLRLVWRLQLKFRRSQRDRFDIRVPTGYDVDKVEGTNVRGWEVTPGDQHQTVAVTLLKAAKEQEVFTVHLWRRKAVAQEDADEFNAPVVDVAGAALHNGEVTVRHSPLLRLQTLDHTGLTRVDLGAEAAKLAGGVDSEESPLGIRPYEAYRFSAAPFTLALRAAQLESKNSATVRSVLKIAEYQRNLESHITFRVQGPPIHVAEILVPGDLKLETVSAPGEFHWALTDIGDNNADNNGDNNADNNADNVDDNKDDRRLLTVYLAAGQEGDVSLLIGGILGEPGPIEQMALPRVAVRRVERQQCDLAVQVDPAYAIEAADLVGCSELKLFRQQYGWLNPGQRNLTRLAVHCSKPDYSGILKLSLRTPVVNCSTITNVRVTDRTIEETILLDYTIRDAGIQTLSFLLPDWMGECRISVPMLRKKTIERAGDGQLRVTLELQDEVMDRLCVLVENDRLLTPKTAY